jgi:hypothetical protein
MEVKTIENTSMESLLRGVRKCLEMANTLVDVSAPCVSGHI